MDDFIKSVQDKGWDLAFKEFIQRVDRESPTYLTPLLTYVLDESRAAWKYLLKPEHKKRVLDLGCGWGSTAISLAGTFRNVYAADLVLDRLRLLRERAEHHGIRNVRYVCCGDTTPLPFASGFFDAVILNGVLEWVACSRGGRPDDVQLAFLKEIRRILAAGGEVYIGIENRLSYRYLLGQPDDHSNLLFGSLMPRPLANLYSRIKRGTPYRTYTYTKRGYRHLLNRAGFTGASFYAPIPDYQFFGNIVDLDSPGVANTRESSSDWISRLKFSLLARKRWAGIFCSSFSIVASKDARHPPTFINALLDHILPVSNGQSAGILDGVIKVRQSGTVVLAANAKRRNIVRIPIDRPAELECRRNHHALVWIHGKIALRNLHDVIPEGLASGTYNGQRYFVESALPGVLGVRLSGRYHSRAMDSAIRFISEFHLSGVQRQLMDDNTFGKLITPVRKVLQHFIGLRPEWGSINASIKHMTDTSKNELLGRNLPLVPTHGDYWLGNILFRDDTFSVSGVFDWSRFSDMNFPLLDVMHLIAYSKITAKTTQVGYILKDYLLQEQFSREEIGWLAQYRERLGLSEDTLRAFIRLYCLYHTALHVCHMRIPNPVWQETYMKAVFGDSGC